MTSRPPSTHLRIHNSWQCWITNRGHLGNLGGVGAVRLVDGANEKEEAKDGVEDIGKQEAFMRKSSVALATTIRRTGMIAEET